MKTLPQYPKFHVLGTGKPARRHAWATHGLLWGVPALVFLVLAGFLTPSVAQDTLYYNRSADPGWNTATSWSLVDAGGPFDSVWITESIADFGSGAARNFLKGTNIIENISVSGLLNAGSGIEFEGTGTNPMEITMVDNPVVTGTFSFAGRTWVFGSYQLVDATITHSGSGGGSDASGDPVNITMTDSSFRLGSAGRVNSNYSIEANGSSTVLWDTRSATVSTLGQLSMQGGTVAIGSTIGSGSSSVQILHLEGEAGSSLV